MPGSLPDDEGNDAAYGRLRSAVLPQGRRLPVGVPGAHQRPRVHSAHRAGALHRVVPPQSRVERVPRHPRAHVRSSVRAGVPPRPRRRQAGRDLPPQARRRRLSRRRLAACCRRRRRRRTASASRSSAPARRRSPSPTISMPLGYEVTIFEKLDRPGGLMRIEHPVVPPAGQGARRGVRLHPRHGRHRRPVLDAGREPEGAARPTAASTPCSSARARRAARTSTSPAATTRPITSTSASSGSSRSHFGHIDDGRQARAHHRRRQHRDGLLPLGASASAPAACSVIGAQAAQVLQGVAVGARGRRRGEGRHPRGSRAGALRLRGGAKLVGMEFERFRSTGSERQAQAGEARQRHPAVRRRHPRHRPGERVPVDRARHRHRVRQASMPVVDKTTFMSTRPGVFFGGDAAWGPENIIWAVEHGHQAAISIHNHCQGDPRHRAPASGAEPRRRRRWACTSGRTRTTTRRRRAPRWSTSISASGSCRSTTEVELGFNAEQTRAEVERCLNCDVQTGFVDKLCIECDACIDVCPMDCLTIAKNDEEPALRTKLTAPATNAKQPLFVSARLEADGPGDGQRRRRVLALRAVRGALPDARVGHGQVRAVPSTRR